MAYQKQQFKNYAVLTAEQLNHIEDGIVAAENNANSRVKTVNGINPDINGNVNLPTSDGTVKTVNGVAPDESGNVDVVGIARIVSGGTAGATNSHYYEIHLTDGTVLTVNDGTDGKDGVDGTAGANGTGIFLFNPTGNEYEKGGENCYYWSAFVRPSGTPIANGSLGLTENGDLYRIIVVQTGLTYCKVEFMYNILTSGGVVKTVNGVTPDENGNVAITIPEGGNVDCLPEYSEADNGKVLGIVNGSPAWIEATVNGGGETPDVPDTPVEPDSHGIVWDLVNVTSSNSAVSVSDGSALVAVLTPAEGYTLGDVTVTMGGEVVTGACNADTATVTIPSVTGDVVVSCAGVAIPSEVRIYPTFTKGKPDDTTGAVASTGSRFTSELIDCSQYALKIAVPATSEYFNETEATCKCGVYAYQADGTYIGKALTVWTTVNKGETVQVKAGAYYRVTFTATGCLSNDAALSFCNNDLELYHITVPIVEENASVAELVDNDYAMDYGVAMASLVTDNAMTDSGELDTNFAAVVETAKNDWMTEANGNIDKIPLIIHTDQHSNFDKPLFDFISKIVDWYDVGKVINLGDTVNDYGAEDLLNHSGLDAYVESMTNIPYSKRIEIFGNHDTWGDPADGTGRFTPQNHLFKWFRNIYARRFDNHGSFVTYDNNYNVKYVVVSPFAYDSDLGGYSHYTLSSATIDKIISELEKVDGYDVIVLSHVPLNTRFPAMWEGRKAKTSGSITDEYGIVHAFDFTGCNGELLCCLHGHNHKDEHGFIGVLQNVGFDAFYNSNHCIYFVLVDRENRQLNIWKVDNTPQSQNFQIPFDPPETTE